MRLIRELRKLKAKIERAEKDKGALKVEMMLLLVEYRPKELLWRDDYASWDELLRGEKPCSVTAYYRFERGLKLLGLEDVKRFGVTATATIVIASVDHRARLIKATRKWFSDYKGQPNHKQVAKFVWHKRRRLAPEEAFVSRGRLIRYVDALKAQLKDAGLRPKPLNKIP